MLPLNENYSKIKKLTGYLMYLTGSGLNLSIEFNAIQLSRKCRFRGGVYSQYIERNVTNFEIDFASLRFFSVPDPNVFFLCGCIGHHRFIYF